MGFELPSPLLPKLLNGLLGQNGPGHGHGPGGINGAEGPDNDPDNSAHHARQAALQNERAAEAGNDQGRWQQSEGANNDGVRRGNGPHEGHHGPQGPGNSSSVGNGHLPTPGGVLSDIVGKADAAARGLLGDGPPGLVAKGGDLAANLLNQAAQTVQQATQTAQTAAGLAAKSLEAMPLANTATAANALLTQATAQALNAPGAQALAARNALHDAASAPVIPARDAAAPLQMASTNPLAGSTIVPGASRAADAALLQGRQDLPMPMRAEQAVVDRSASVLPGSNPPPAAPIAADTARAIPVMAPPSTVPPSQTAAAMEGRSNLIGGGGDRVGGVPKAADMAQPQQTPPGHTGAAPTRIGRRDEQAGESLAQRMARALMALLGLAPAEADAPELDEEALAQAAAENRWQRLQWVFWTLAVVGYACLVFALIVFIPGGSGFLDETRNPFGTPALIVGLTSSLGAWWFARKLAANAEPAPPPASD